MKRPLLYTALLLAAAFAAAGCFKPGHGKDASAPVAWVGGKPITSKELRRELAQRARKDPLFRMTPDSVREQLDILVNRRLLIQEAQERKLTEDERFTQTIQTFWEQTLVRLLMDRLYAEFDDSVIVTEEEMRRYYDRLGQRATFRMLADRDAAVVEAARKTLEEGGDVKWQKTFGPIRLPDARSEALDQAFDLEPNQARVYQDGANSVLIQLVSKEQDVPPPYSAIRDKIKTLLRERKERHMFDDWIAKKRRASGVKLTPEKFEAAA